ncbi:MAG TPA: type VI secretion system-associated protein TagF [Polyangiaceae bacterium]|nr:type VI secretion system-associated protein TagF [Polyangiaceae bacterium]
MTAYEIHGQGILGKVPYVAEFVRAHGGDHGLAGYDAWVAESFEWALGHAGRAFPDAFASGGVHAFALRADANADELVAGVVGPSADSAGRRFPLTVAGSVRAGDALVARPEVTPLVFESLWAAAGELWSPARSGEVSDLRAAAAGFRPASDLGVDEALGLYAEWAARVRVSELWESIGLEAAGAGDCLRLFVAAVEPFRGVERPETRLSLRLPLGRAGGVALCFWIDALRRNLRWRRTVPSFFWWHESDRGAALVHLGTPPRATLAELFLPSDTRDEVCDLSSGERSSDPSALPPLADSILGVLGRPGATVAELLASLDGG